MCSPPSAITGRARVAIVLDGDRRPVGYVTEDVAEGTSGLVHEIARVLPATVPARADLRAVVSEMFAHDTMWLACVDHDGRFAGVITQPAVTAVLGETYRRSAEKAKIAAVLNELSAMLDDETTARLNARVDVERVSIENVAAEVLKEQCLV